MLVSSSAVHTRDLWNTLLHRRNQLRLVGDGLHGELVVVNHFQVRRSEQRMKKNNYSYNGAITYMNVRYFTCCKYIQKGKLFVDSEKLWRQYFIEILFLPSLLGSPSKRLMVGIARCCVSLLFETTESFRISLTSCVQSSFHLRFQRNAMDVFFWKLPFFAVGYLPNFTSHWPNL